MSELQRIRPWTTLWYKPAATLQGLIAAGRGERVAIGLAASFGAVQGWFRFSQEPGGSPGMFFGSLSIGVLGLYFFSWLLRNFGRWFGGGGQLAEVRTALGWGLLPWTVVFAVMGFIIQVREVPPQQLFPFFFIGQVYGFVILLSALSSALRLSFMGTFFCFVVTTLVSLFPLTLILQLVTGASGPSGP